MGTFAPDACSIDAERLTERVDALFANLCGKNTIGRRVAETLNELDVIFKVDRNSAAKFLARIISKKYAAATDLYMNARHGLELNHADRAVLGEQFRTEIYELITKTMTALKKKRPPINSEVKDFIQFNCDDVAEFLANIFNF